MNVQCMKRKPEEELTDNEQISTCTYCKTRFLDSFPESYDVCCECDYQAPAHLVDIEETMREIYNEDE